MSIPNVFAIYDYPCNTNLGAGGFAEKENFTAPTLVAAQNVGQQYATLFQKTILMTQKFGLSSASYISFAPSVTLLQSALPSGISF